MIVGASSMTPLNITPFGSNSQQDDRYITACLDPLANLPTV
jgi:hypothetical protein